MAVPEESWLCAEFLSGACEKGIHCGGLHHDLPYLWQAHLENCGWTVLPVDATALEQAYSQPGAVCYTMEIPITYRDGVSALIPFEVNLVKMVGHIQHASDRWGEQSFVKLRRLSTPSYTTPVLGGPPTNPGADAKPPSSSCPWRWYYKDDTCWKLFEEDGYSPMQWVLEAKFLAGQKIYRFEVDMPIRDSKLKEYGKEIQSMTFLLNYTCCILVNLNTRKECEVRRRPLFVPPTDCILRRFPPLPPTRPIACSTSELPVKWFPVDQKADFELVPLDPESVDYHLVASEFIGFDPDWKILDIYRLQNPFLWHKFSSKKQYMELKNKNANEMLLFHGTSAEVSVQAIFRQNFDWRLCGKNGTVFGDGSYFARDPSLSDRYTGSPDSVKIRWMFLARVLVGRYAKGEKGAKRPPPLDPAKPHGDCYDSCVNRIKDPSIYVVFENDQCYPEYVVCYSR